MSGSICMRDHWVLYWAGTWMGWWYWRDLKFTQGCTHGLFLTILLKISRGSPTTCLPDLRKPMAMCLPAKNVLFTGPRAPGLWVLITEKPSGAVLSHQMIQQSMSGSRGWSSWQWLCMWTLLVVPALPSGSDFPVPRRKSCRLRVVWSCPWCWSLTALGSRVPRWLQMPLATSKESFQSGACGINLLWSPQNWTDVQEAGVIPSKKKKRPQFKDIQITWNHLWCHLEYIY